MKGKQALLSLGMLEKKSLRIILENGLDERIDDDKFLHIRLSLGRLVQGIGVLSMNKDEPVAKGKFKLEVYPGQEPIDVAEKILGLLIGE
jgi:RNA binding exosome subunit